MDKILVIGACGQLGSELTFSLRDIFGEQNVVASDLFQPKNELSEGLFEQLDVTDGKRLDEVVRKHKITQIYHLAAILSAKGEQNPLWAWQINMDGLLNVLEIAKAQKMNKVYWPSSIATFGPSTPKSNTPQTTVMEPSTVYGISKLTGELWCQYYFDKYGLDTRSLRYPGLIGYKSLPGGGTTDYAVDIYHKALEGGEFECFLSENTYLPMMYMPDALKATLDIMHSDKIKLHTSYNVSGMSFSPKEMGESIRKEIPNFEMSYQPDFRQAIADSWPSSLDDSKARADWGWKPKFDLQAMTADMLLNLRKMKAVSI
ncbi:MAG: nucleoside-diphosphate-sugar epimerase [Arenicella sp.]|jgi:nucleoside-diphosphate-sugar epimerase